MRNKQNYIRFFYGFWVILFVSFLSISCSIIAGREGAKTIEEAPSFNQSKLEKLTDQVTELTVEKDNLNSAYQEALKKWTDELRTKGEKLTQYAGELENLKQQNQNLIREKETVEQKLQESDDKNTILSDKITSLMNKERKQLIAGVIILGICFILGIIVGRKTKRNILTP